MRKKYAIIYNSYLNNRNKYMGNLLNRVVIKLTLIKTQLWYKLFFKYIGKNTIIHKPLLLRGSLDIVIGNRTLIEHNSTLYNIDKFLNKDYFGKILIGNNCYINHDFNITCANSVTVEDDVTIAYNVSIFDNMHGSDPIIGNYNKQPLIVKNSIIVGQGSWVGANCFIMSSIGKGCIIGANSVVTKSIPDYCMAVGNPARVIKKYDFEAKEWIKV